MTFDPILAAPLIVQLHVISALSAVVLGPIALFRRSRDIWHRRTGKLWVAAMFSTAATSFGISAFPVLGPFSPIHVLSLLTILGLRQGIAAVRRHDIARHQKEMRSLYFWAMGVAGLFTFLPERRMNLVLFPNHPQEGFWIMAALIGGGLLWYTKQSRRKLA